MDTAILSENPEAVPCHDALLLSTGRPALEATSEIVLIYLRDILVTCQKTDQELAN